MALCLVSQAPYPFIRFIAQIVLIQARIDQVNRAWRQGAIHIITKGSAANELIKYAFVHDGTITCPIVLLRLNLSKCGFLCAVYYSDKATSVRMDSHQVTQEVNTNQFDLARLTLL